MSEKDETQNQTPKDGEGKATDITIKVDRSQEIKDLQDQLKKAEDERKKAEDDLQAKADELKTLADEKKALEEDKGDLESKMQLIAEKEFEKKKQILLAKAKKLFITADGKEDEAKVKKLTDQLNQEDSKKSAEALKLNEYLIGHLEEALVKGAEAKQKAKAEQAQKNKDKAQANKDAGTEKGSEAQGQTPLTGEEQTGEQTTEGDSWDSHYAMIADLRRRARDPKDPEKQAEAQAILQELWKKWATTVKKDYGQGKMDFKPEKQKTIRQLHKEGV
jgi:hypothetical protein